MAELKIKVAINSPTLLGSGEGMGALIDTDIVFDEWGFPIFPARRLKGLLRESAEEIVEMCKLAQINILDKINIKDIFGTGGKESEIIFHNLYLEDYEEAVKWMAYAQKGLNMINQESVLEVVTILRQQTSIDGNGVAEENSLRTSRALKPGYTFEGIINVPDEGDIINLLALACTNLRHVGSKRNRGFGEVQCTLWDSQGNLNSKALQKIKGGIA